MATNTKFHAFVGDKENRQKGFCVDVHQRFYSWKVANVRDLWNDIQGATKESHFMGTLVIRKNEKVWITDGQQRLTSLFLLLSRLVSRLDTRPPINIRSWYTLRDSLYRCIAQDESLLFESNPLDNDVFVTLCRSGIRDGNPVTTDNTALFDQLPDLDYTTPSQQKLKDAFIYFRNQCRSLTDDDIKTLFETIQDMQFLVFSEGDEVKTLKIFHTLNSRGIALTQVDVLKNSLFLKMHDLKLEQSTTKELHQSISSCFQTIFTSLNNVEKHEKWEDLMLSYVWLGFYGTEISSSALVSEFMKQITDKDSVTLLLSRLSSSYNMLSIFKFSQYESKICSLQLPYSIVVDMVLIYLFYGFKPHIIIPLLGMWNKDKSKIGEVLHLLAKYVFRVYYLCTKRKDTGKPDLLRATRAFVQADSSLSAAIQNLAIKHSPLKSLKQSLLYNDKSEWYAEGEENISLNNGVRALLWAYECMAAEKIFPWEDCTVEHVLPKSWETNWDKWQHDDAESWKNTLGNLCTLSPSENAKSSNASFDRKKQIYQESAFSLVKLVAKKEAWDIKSIAEHYNLLFNWITNFLVTF